MRDYHAWLEATFLTMIEVNPDTRSEPGVTTLRLRPNRALSRRGMWILGCVLAGSTLITAVIGAEQGNVYAPLFALIESLAVAVCLVLAWHGGSRYECIRLDADVLEVEAGPGRHRTRFQSGWVRVRLLEGSDRQHLLLASHGRRLEIGAFLADPEREALLQKLNAVLSGLKAPRRDSTLSRDVL
ncbi:MAG: DUF2244 domain-containing protein [Rhodanobacteraceae bacterium]